MTLCLNAIAELGPAGDDRAAVLRTLLTEQAQDTPIGPVAFSPSGTLIGGTYTLYGVARDGSLVRATGR
jgi:ABC-type branched-subunit amino acid transport system substrate-binding protein